MMTKSGGGAMVIPRRPILKLRCVASKITNTEYIRAELHQLHAEAETTRAKANSARLRLMRLSEAVQNLRSQAAVNVQRGKENDARELLFQKKMILQALEKAKTRIELLDQLSTKLNEAISVKENQLIGNIALELEVEKEHDSPPVRIVSPKQEPREDENESEESRKETGDEKNLLFSADSEDKGTEELQSSVDLGIFYEDDTKSSFSQHSSYEGLLEHLDHQLHTLEMELVVVLNVSAMVLNQEDKTKSLKVQQTIELLEGIRSVRQRIANIMQAEAKMG